MDGHKGDALAEELKRSYIRFHPEPLDIAVIDLNQEHLDSFTQKYFQFEGNTPSLIIDQSYKGCSVAIHNREQSDEFFKIGFRCLIKVGELAPLRAEVRWREKLSEEILKIGFEFLD
jgi:hypothetical protein